MFKFFLTAALSLCLSFPAFAESNPAQPSVARRVLICDQWQWIGNGATTWGCLTVPRQGFVAGGQITDEVVKSLQDQINKLKAELRQLKPAINNAK